MSVSFQGHPNNIGWNNITAPKLGDPCPKCRKRPSTTPWAGGGGVFAWSHGFYQFWCDVCVLSAQLKHAREQAKKVPELQRKLRNAKRRKPR